MLISNDSQKPLVRVYVAGKYQLRIAFNAALMRGVDLHSDRMAIDWDEANQRLTFIADVGNSYKGGWTFALSHDGAFNIKRNGRALFVTARRLRFLKPGKYEPVLGEVVGGDDNPEEWPGFEGMRHPTISITLTNPSTTNEV